MDYKLKWPNVKGRKRINTDDINYGDVVAVAEVYTNTFTNEIEFGRTGLAVMYSSDWAIWYINLCKEEGRVWVNDPLPDDVMLFEPTEEEEYFGKLILLQENFNTNLYDVLHGKVLKYSAKWGDRFWDDAIDAIAEAKKLRVEELENLKLIRKVNSKDKLCLK